MNRLARVRESVDRVLRQQPDAEQSRCGFVHLYEVAAAAALLAIRRGMDPDLCSTAAMLHDISSYESGSPEDHARLSAERAGQILDELDGFTAEERRIICDAIARHSDKGVVHGPVDELLKDADVLQYYLYDPSAPGIPSRQRRLDAVLYELGVPGHSWVGFRPCCGIMISARWQPPGREAIRWRPR